jgi:hypothetical protein
MNNGQEKADTLKIDNGKDPKNQVSGLRKIRLAIH